MMKSGPAKSILIFVIPTLLNTVIIVSGSSAEAFPFEDILTRKSLNQNQSQNNSGLSPDKKKSLSKYGPEDIFSNTPNRKEKRKKAAQVVQRSAPTVTPTPTPSPKPSRSVMPSPTVTKTVAPSAKASKTPAVALVEDSPQPPLPDQPSNLAVVLSSLAALSLLVLTAFIYVLFKLVEKLREGSS